MDAVTVAESPPTPPTVQPAVTTVQPASATVRDTCIDAIRNDPYHRVTSKHFGDNGRKVVDSPISS